MVLQPAACTFYRTEASAPGKLILCGEHAVVYGCPAIALPLASVRAQAQIEPGLPGRGLLICAPDLNDMWAVADTLDNPLSALVLATLRQLEAPPTDLIITISSNIPIASGMGSGAAVATAIVRALSAHLGHALTPFEVSDLVYQSEQRYHGTPSGIDNTVIAFERAVWFKRQAPAPLIEPVTITKPFMLVIGDTGIRSETRLSVGEVRQRWQADTSTYEALFEQVSQVVHTIRDTLASGNYAPLGALLDKNQALLEQIGVSSPELERLVAAARAAGAAGAKLSGGGWGGIMCALTDPEHSGSVAQALQDAGAVRVLETSVG